jgi:hypothetical protein
MEEIKVISFSPFAREEKADIPPLYYLESNTLNMERKRCPKQRPLCEYNE